MNSRNSHEMNADIGFLIGTPSESRRRLGQDSNNSSIDKLYKDKERNQRKYTFENKKRLLEKPSDDYELDVDEEITNEDNGSMVDPLAAASLETE